EAGGERDLRLVDHVPQDDADQQVQRDLAGRSGLASREDADRAEEYDVDHRPDDDVEAAVRAALEHVAVAPRDGHDAPERRGHAVICRNTTHLVAPARWRNTASRSSCP